MDNGWIKLHRKILYNPIAKNGLYAWLWIVLLLKAGHREDKFMWNGGILDLKPGQFITGRKKLSIETGISQTTIERILEFLESQQQIGQQKTNKYRLITILNWEDYQLEDNKRTTNGQQTDTIKKYKKIKKNTSETEVSPGIPLIIDLFKEINPSYSKWYGNKTQRKAVSNLLELNGFEKLSKVIALLPKTNKIPYLPTITTPLQLEDKWASLEIALTKEKNKSREKFIGIA